MAAAVRRKGGIRPPIRKSYSAKGIPPPSSSAIAARENKASVEADPSMAASFLPYCSNCDKQIVIPNNGILYCSEACRRKDRENKPAPIPISGSAPLYQQVGFNPWATPPLSPRLGYSELPPPPTLITPTSPTSARFIPLSRNPSSSGENPSFSPPSDPIPLHRRSAYDVSYPSVSAPPSPTGSSGVYLPPRRPTHLVRSNTHTSIPSLANSPTFHGHHHSISTAYQGNYTRPLPPLHNPYSYCFPSSPRSIDLVTPISSITSQPATLATSNSSNRSADEFYEKKTISGYGQGNGSLKKLFNFEGMRAAPQQSMRSSPMASRAVSPAPVITSFSRTGSPAPRSATEHMKLKDGWSDIYQ